MSKYRNKKTMVDGHIFDSLKEAKRYGELKSLMQDSKISMLKLQPKFVLQESFRDSRVGLTKAGKPRTVRAITFTADFQYFDHEAKRLVVEDVKSPASKTTSYEIRKRLFLRQNPELDFREI